MMARRKTRVYLYPDTNIILEGKDIRNIPWRQAAPAANEIYVVLLISTIKEVDRSVYSGAERKQLRARRIKTFIRNLRKSPESTDTLGGEIRVTINRLPSYEWVDGLDRNDADDRFLAEVIAHEPPPEADKVVLTHDTVMNLKAEALGLVVFEAPDDWIMPSEDDKLRQRLRLLEGKVNELESSRPVLDLYFVSASGDRTTKISHSIQKSRRLEEGQVEKFLKLEASKRELSELDLALTTAHLARIYRSYIQSYLQHFKEYLNQYALFVESRFRVFECSVCLKNEGAAPAEDLEVDIVPSPGLTIFKDQPYQVPKLPRVPDRPKHSAFPQLHVPSPGSMTADLLSWGAGPRDRRARNPRRFYWEEDGGCGHHGKASRLRLSCNQFMHGGAVEEIAFFVVPDSEVEGGEVSAKVSAANVTTQVAARLVIHVAECDAEARDPLEELEKWY